MLRQCPPRNPPPTSAQDLPWHRQPTSSATTSTSRPRRRRRRKRFANYNPTASWVSDNRAEIGFSAKGVKLSGAIQIEPGEIHLELDVPFIFRPLRGKALDIIEEQIQMWVDKAKSGELD